MGLGAASVLETTNTGQVRLTDVVPVGALAVVVHVAEVGAEAIVLRGAPPVAAVAGIVEGAIRVASWLMSVFQTKSFKKWAAKEGIPKERLLDAVDRIDENLGIVDLGNGLYKVRMAKNKGKSGGYRTLVVYKKDFRCLFIYGFEKNRLANIGEKEILFYRKNAQNFLSYSI